MLLEGIPMGLCLFPGDGEIDGPDACFSYQEFASFRRRLASGEGFSLDDMQGFGGNALWSDVTTVLEPLLNHPDDHGRNFSSEECRLILPHLEGVLADWMLGPDSNSEIRNQTRELRDLVAVLRVCVQKNVELCFM
ncbi:hypothetical protein ACFRMN_00495 [Streptomyces sp. NPDC056835]|uniref:hypothetical protein n=1 Tax=Streptomyces sp. NPDC056835 TaxID=3345956 RepID=UPI0036BD1F6E